MFRLTGLSRHCQIKARIAPAIRTESIERGGTSGSTLSAPNLPHMASKSGTGRPKVIVVGGGFGGLHVVQGLKHVEVDVTLLDRQNHHLFQPLLYQVASAVLSPADIAQPIRRMLRHQQNVRVVLGEVDRVDLNRNRITVGGTDAEYDYLVLAPGATHSYFGHDTWAEHAPGLKTVTDALEIRRRILSAFEAAEIEADSSARNALLTFVIVGAGPTGVELAGALKEIAVESVRADFRNVDTSATRVILIEAQGRVLPSLSERASARALRDLEKMGVDVLLHSQVTDINHQEVAIGPRRISTSNVFWAAGVQASKLNRSLGVELDRAGRVKVNPDCSVPGYPEVFVVGDAAHLAMPQQATLVPGVAQAAMQMGDFVARRIRALVKEAPDATPPAAFRYRDKGSMAAIGRARAVADIRGFTFGGVGAWLIWSLVHILFLIGFRNKLFVMLSWVWNYVVSTKGARLITGEPRLSIRQPLLTSSTAPTRARDAAR